MSCLLRDFIQVRQGQLIVNGVAQNEHYTAPHASSYTMEAMVQRSLVCPLLLHKQMQYYTTTATATARGGPKVAWLLRVVDFLSTPIILSKWNDGSHSQMVDDLSLQSSLFSLSAQFYYRIHLLLRLSIILQRLPEGHVFVMGAWGPLPISNISWKIHDVLHKVVRPSNSQGEGLR